MDKKRSDMAQMRGRKRKHQSEPPLVEASVMQCKEKPFENPPTNDIKVEPELEESCSDPATQNDLETPELNTTKQEAESQEPQFDRTQKWLDARDRELHIRYNLPFVSQLTPRPSDGTSSDFTPLPDATVKKPRVGGPWLVGKRTKKSVEDKFFFKSGISLARAMNEMSPLCDNKPWGRRLSGKLYDQTYSKKTSREERSWNVERLYYRCQRIIQSFKSEQ